MSAFERFLAGEDRLAALLQALPAFEPSPAFEAAFSAAARAAQAERDATNRTAALGFAPPASLETSFLKMAASIDAAQAPRREALLADIAKGSSPEAAIGAPLQPATAEWLAAQATAAAPARTEKPARKPVWLSFSWFDLRLAGLAAILAAVGIQLVLKFQPSPQEVAIQDVFQSALQTRAPSNKQELAQAAERSLVDAKIALDRANAANEARQQDKAKASAQPDAQALGMKAEAAAEPAEIGPPAHLIASAPKPAAIAGGMPTEPRADSLSAQSALSAAPIAPVQAGSLEKSVASTYPAARSETETPDRRERAIGDIAQNEAKEAERTSPVAKKLAVAPSQAPVPARAATAQMAAAARAPIMAAAPVPAQDITNKLDALRESVSARLGDAPADVAARLPLRPAGQSWAVYSATPKRAELRAWVEALRLSIPANRRPDRFLIIKEDGPPDTLRIIPPPAAP